MTLLFDCQNLCQAESEIPWLPCPEILVTHAFTSIHLAFQLYTTMTHRSRNVFKFEVLTYGDRFHKPGLLFFIQHLLYIQQFFIQ